MCIAVNLSTGEAHCTVFEECREHKEIELEDKDILYIIDNYDKLLYCTVPKDGTSWHDLPDYHFRIVYQDQINNFYYMPEIEKCPLLDNFVDIVSQEFEKKRQRRKELWEKNNG